MSQNSGVAALDIRPVESKADLRRFIRVPWTIYDSSSNWVPPLLMMAHDQVKQQGNAFFDHAQAQYWIAYRKDKPVGRISAQIDSLATGLYGNVGHFGMIEAIDDCEVFKALFDTAEDWLRKHGMERAQGPYNLSINQECGLLINGFDTPPMLMMGHAPAYYLPRIEKQGYNKIKDLFAYHLDITRQFPNKIQSLLRRAGSQTRLIFRQINMRKLDDDLLIVFDIINDAWSTNWGFVPETKEELKQASKDLRLLIKPEINYIAELDGEPIGFMITLPNLNEAIADLNGRLLPFGWAKLLWRLKMQKMRTVRVPFMGVRKKYQSTLIGSYTAFVLIETIRRNAIKLGYREAELSWLLEDNDALANILLAIGCRTYKTYRLFEKTLGSETEAS